MISSLTPWDKSSHKRSHTTLTHRESANIEVAIRAALHIGNSAAALRACGRFSYYWMAERPGAGLALTNDVHAHTNGTENEIDRAWGDLALGCLGQVVDPVDDARDSLERAARSFERWGERIGLTAARYWLALLTPTKELSACVVALATETNNPYLLGWAKVDYAYGLLYTWQPGPNRSFEDLADEVKRTLDVVDGIIAEHGFEPLRLGVIDARVKLRLVHSQDAPQLAADSALASFVEESERLARGIGSPWYFLGAMRLAGLVNFRCGRFHECRLAVDELLEVAIGQDSPLLDDLSVTIKGILLAACLLHQNGDWSTGRRIVASIAPSTARHPNAWIEYNAPIPALAGYIREQQIGNALKSDDVYRLATQCRILLHSLTAGILIEARTGPVRSVSNDGGGKPAIRSASTSCRHHFPTARYSRVL